jgi:hypothetical protein
MEALTLRGRSWGVVNFDNPSALQDVPWSFAVEPMFTGVIACIVQLFCESILSRPPRTGLTEVQMPTASMSSPSDDASSLLSLRPLRSYQLVCISSSRKKERLTR